MDKPIFKKDLSCHIPEHEILLGFTNDSDAEAFYYWFQECGWENFQQWHKKYLNLRDLSKFNS